MRRLGDESGVNLVSETLHRCAVRTQEQDSLLAQAIRERGVFRRVAPASPHRVATGALGNLHDAGDICVIVVVGSSRNFAVLVRHSDVPNSDYGGENGLGIGGEILRRGHNNDADDAIVLKRLVAPLPDRANGLHGRDAVVGDEQLANRPFPSKHEMKIVAILLFNHIVLNRGEWS